MTPTMTSRLRLLGLLLTLLCVSALSAAAPGWMVLFGTPDCDDCRAFKEDWADTAGFETEAVLVFVDVAPLSGYRRFSELEEALGGDQERSTAFPVILVGGKFHFGAEGLDRVREEAGEMLKTAWPSHPLLTGIRQAAEAAEPGSIVSYTFPDEPVRAAASIAPTSAMAARLLFFEQPGCRKCARQSREFALLRERLPHLEVTSCDVTTLRGQAMLSRARQHLSLPDGDQNLAPLVCWPNGFITGRLATADELETALRATATTDDAPFWLEPLSDGELRGETDRLQRLISGFTLSAVLGGGLLDGINPCAFATSIFLISYLLYLRRSRRDILLVGACFCLGVFLTYFLFGFALSVALRQLQQWQWVKSALFGLFGVAGLVLCALHLRDALIYRRTGRASDMDMGLSKNTHRSIHERIRRLTTVRVWLLGPAALALGAIISAMELACTGQVYFPVIAALSEQGLNARFVLLLLLYNVCFILPLAVITVLAAGGVGAKSLGDWAKRHLIATKVSMAVLFAVLGVLMLTIAVRPLL